MRRSDLRTKKRVSYRQRDREKDRQTDRKRARRRDRERNRETEKQKERQRERSVARVSVLVLHGEHWNLNKQAATILIVFTYYSYKNRITTQITQFVKSFLEYNLEFILVLHCTGRRS